MAHLTNPEGNEEPHLLPCAITGPTVNSEQALAIDARALGIDSADLSIPAIMRDPDLMNRLSPDIQANFMPYS